MRPERMTDLPSMSGPAEYRIQVRGHLPDDWADRLGNLAIRRWTAEDGSRITNLRGRLADQAELSGVLNTLYSLQMPVVSVECTS